MATKKHWIKDLKDNQCIHAHTRKIAKKLCKKFHRLGLSWSNGDSYLDDNGWNLSKEETVYYPSKGTYGDTWCSNIAGSEVITIDQLHDFDSVLKGFIEVTVLSTVGNGTETKQLKDIELIPLSDIARVYGNIIMFKTPYGNGRNYANTAHTYEEIKELIKQAL